MLNDMLFPLYVLVEKKVVKSFDTDVYEQAFDDIEAGKNIVKKTYFFHSIQPPFTQYMIEISTVFLGLQFPVASYDKGIPLFFETKIFGGDEDLDGWTHRYPTWESAEFGHNEVIKMVLATFDQVTR